MGKVLLAVVMCVAAVRAEIVPLDGTWRAEVVPEAQGDVLPATFTRTIPVPGHWPLMKPAAKAGKTDALWCKTTWKAPAEIPPRTVLRIGKASFGPCPRRHCVLPAFPRGRNAPLGEERGLRPLRTHREVARGLSAARYFARRKRVFAVRAGQRPLPVGGASRAQGKRMEEIRTVRTRRSRALRGGRGLW